MPALAFHFLLRHDVWWDGVPQVVVPPGDPQSSFLLDTDQALRGRAVPSLAVGPRDGNKHYLALARPWFIEDGTCSPPRLLPSGLQRRPPHPFLIRFGQSLHTGFCIKNKTSHSSDVQKEAGLAGSQLVH